MWVVFTQKPRRLPPLTSTWDDGIEKENEKAIRRKSIRRHIIHHVTDSAVNHHYRFPSSDTWYLVDVLAHPEFASRTRTSIKKGWCVFHVQLFSASLWPSRVPLATRGKFIFLLRFHSPIVAVSSSSQRNENPLETVHLFPSNGPWPANDVGYLRANTLRRMAGSGDRRWYLFQRHRHIINPFFFSLFEHRTWAKSSRMLGASVHSL